MNEIESGERSGQPKKNSDWQNFESSISQLLGNSQERLERSVQDRAGGAPKSGNDSAPAFYDHAGKPVKDLASCKGGEPLIKAMSGENGQQVLEIYADKNAAMSGAPLLREVFSYRQEGGQLVESRAITSPGNPTTLVETSYDQKTNDLSFHVKNGNVEQTITIDPDSRAKAFAISDGKTKLSCDFEDSKLASVVVDNGNGKQALKGQALSDFLSAAEHTLTKLRQANGIPEPLDGQWLHPALKSALKAAQESAQPLRETTLPDKTVCRYNNRDQVVQVDRADGHKIRVERGDDGAIIKLSDSRGPVTWESKDGGKSFVQSGSDGKTKVEGTATVTPNGDYEFRSVDRVFSRQKDGIRVTTGEGSSLHNNDSSSVFFDKAGRAENSTTATGITLGVRRETASGTAGGEGRVIEASIGDQVWRRSKEAGKENLWISNDGRQRTGEFTLANDGSMHFKDAIGKGELVNKLDGSVLEKDAQQHVRRLTTPDRQVYNFSYDADGRLNTVQFPDGTLQVRLPDRIDGNKKVERWVESGTDKIKDGSYTVDPDGTFHINIAGQTRKDIHSDGFAEQQGAKGEKLLVKEFADRSSVTRNDLGQMVETRTPDGQVRKFGYDQSGHLNSVDLGKEGKWTSSDSGKTWTKEGEQPTRAKEACFLLTARGDLVEQRSEDGKQLEVIRKSDGSLLHAENGLYTFQHNALKKDYKLGYNNGVPNRFENIPDDGAYWTSADNKTWVKHTADGKLDPKFKPWEASLGFDPQGNLLIKDMQKKTIQVRGTDGSSVEATLDGRKLSEYKHDKNGEVVDTRYLYDDNNKLLGKDSYRYGQGFIKEKTDARGHITDISKEPLHRSFAYDDPTRPDLITSFNDNGNKYAIDRALLEKGQVVYRNQDPAKAKDTRSLIFTVGKDGSMISRDGGFELTDRLDKTKLVRQQDGSMLDYRADGKLDWTRDQSGYRMGYKYDLTTDLLGRTGRLSAFTYGENDSTWHTTDGFNWVQDGTNKEWKGFVSVNPIDGKMTQRNNGAQYERTLDGNVAKPDDQAVDLFSSADAIEKTTHYTFNSNAIIEIRDQMRTREGKNLERAAEEIQMLKQVYAERHGRSLEDDLYARFDKGSDTHRWAEVNGYLHKTGKPGEDVAIQLSVDEQEIQRWWWNRDRSKSQILESTREKLGNATQEQLDNYSEALQRFTGKDLKTTYTEGGGNTIRTWDKYHETLIGVALIHGKDKRTLQEEVDILKSSLLCGANQLDYFTEAAGGITKASGRQEFIKQNGFDLIEKVFTTRQTGQGGSYEYTDRFAVQQATDFAETGALRPYTAITKASGVFSNDDKVIEHTLDKLKPEQRAQFADGRRISDLMKDSPQVELSKGERESLDFYNKMMSSFRSLHYFGVDRKVEKYIDETMHQGGTDIAVKISAIGNNWTNSEQLNANSIESMDQHTFEMLLAGTNGYAERITREDGSKGWNINGEELDSARQTRFLSDFHKQMFEALGKNLGKSYYVEQAQTLLNDKVYAAVSINDAADNGNLNILQEQIPALKDMSAEKFRELSDGYSLQKKINSGELKQNDLKPEQVLQLKAYQNDAVLRPFMEGREIARQLNEIENGTRARQLFEGRELEKKFKTSAEKPTTDEQQKIDLFRKSGKEIDGLTSNQLSLIIEKQREPFIRQLSPEAAKSLKSYNDVLYDAVSQNTRRSIMTALEQNTLFWGNDRKAMVDSIVHMNASDRESLKNNTNGFDTKLRAKLKEVFSHGAENNAEYKLMDSLLKQVENSEHLVPNAPVMGPTELLLARAAGVDGYNSKDAVAIVSDLLKTDKDGKLAANLSIDKDFKNAAIESLRGDASAFDRQIMPLLSNGLLPADELKARHTHREYSGQGDQQGHPVFDPRGFFKEGILEASPKALKYLSSADGATEREKLLSELKPYPELQKMAKSIISQGRVRDEDQVRAFVLDAGASQEKILAIMKAMPEGRRMEMQSTYGEKYGDNFQANVLAKVNNKERDEFARAVRGQDWNDEQAVSHAIDTVASTNAGIGGQIARSFNITHVEARNQFMQQSYEAAAQGKSLEPAVQEKLNVLVEDTVKSFKETKQSTNDTIVTGAITAGSLALAPFTGGTSLYGLIGISAAMGISGAGLKYALAGNDSDGVREFAGDTFKYTALAFANQLGTGHIARAIGLGEKAAGTAASTALTKAGLETASAEVKDQVKKGMLHLIQEGLDSGGVTNKAVADMVKGVKGLTEANKAVLTRELQLALPNAVRAEMEGATRQVLQTIRMRGQASLAHGTVGGIGNVIGEGSRELVEDGKLNKDGLLNAGTQGVVFSVGISNAMAGAGAAGRVFRRGEAPAVHGEVPRVHSDTPPVVHSDTPPVVHSDTPPVAHSDTPPVVHSDTPPVAHSDTPPVVHSDTPPVVHSDTPPVVHSDTPPVHSDTPPATDPAARAASKDALLKELKTPDERVGLPELRKLVSESGFHTDPDIVRAVQSRLTQEIAHNPNVFTREFMGEVEQQIKQFGLKRTDVQEAIFSRIQTEIRNGANPKQFDQFITNAIDPSMSRAEKIAALQRLAGENQPSVKAWLESIDEKYKTESKTSNKEAAKIEEKAQRPSIIADKPWHDVEHIRDSFRFKTVLPDINDLPRIIAEARAQGFEIVKADTAKVLAPKEWGWRIAAFDMKMPNGQLVEYYLPVKELEAVKKENHLLFEKWRNKDLGQLSPQEIVEYQRDVRTSFDRYNQAWKDYLARTGQTEASVRKVLEETQTIANKGNEYLAQMAAMGIKAEERPDLLVRVAQLDKSYLERMAQMGIKPEEHPELLVRMAQLEKSYLERMTQMGIKPEEQAGLLIRVAQIDPALRAELLDSPSAMPRNIPLETRVTIAETGQKLLNTGINPDDLRTALLAGQKPGDASLWVKLSKIQSADDHTQGLLFDELRARSASGQHDVVKQFLSKPGGQLKSILHEIDEAPLHERASFVSRVVETGHLHDFGPAYHQLLTAPEVQEAAGAAARRVPGKTPDGPKIKELLNCLATGGDFDPANMAAVYQQTRELLSSSPQAQHLLENWHQNYQAARLRPANERLMQECAAGARELSSQEVSDKLYGLMRTAGEKAVTDMQPPEAALIMLKDLEGSNLPEAIRQRQILTRLNQWYDENLRFRASFEGNQVPPKLDGGVPKRFDVLPNEGPATAQAKFAEAVKAATAGLPGPQLKEVGRFLDQTPKDAYHMSVTQVGDGANRRTLLVAAQPSYGNEHAVKMYVQVLGPEGASERLHISVTDGQLKEVKVVDQEAGGTSRKIYWSREHPEKAVDGLPHQRFGFNTEQDFLKYLESLPGKPASPG